MGTKKSNDVPTESGWHKETERLNRRIFQLEQQKDVANRAFRDILAIQTVEVASLVYKYIAKRAKHEMRDMDSLQDEVETLFKADITNFDEEFSD